MITKKMIKEEWRMHSELFRGRYFAMFPVMIFALSLGFTYGVVEYSTLGASVLGDAVQFFGLFVGLAVGSLGFSGKDAMKNVLGPVNFIIYSSRTLPISRRKLMAAFIVKDMIYYTGLFLVPISLGLLIPTGFSTVMSVVNMHLWFLGGLALSVAFARVSLELPTPGLDYSDWSDPLTQKSVLDLWRSSGGIIKVLFSLAVLTGFYWFMVLYFPITGVFLSNPMLSYSVLLGISSLTVYNWVNRFDKVEDYDHLPVDAEMLLESKERAFLLISLSITSLFFLISLFFYRDHILLSYGTMVSGIVYTLGLASYLTGLDPNEKLFDASVFGVYLALNSVLVVPVLFLSVFLVRPLQPYYVGLLMLMLGSGTYLAKRSREKI